MIYLTKNFTYEEFINSSTATKLKINNTPNPSQIETIKRLANLLQIIRDIYNKPITITSGFRNKELNKAVKGSSTSQHLEGSAADIICDDNKALFDLILSLINEGAIEVRQLIWEYGNSDRPDWIHIAIQDSSHSYKKNEVLYVLK